MRNHLDQCCYIKSPRRILPGCALVCLSISASWCKTRHILHAFGTLLRSAGGGRCLLSYLRRFYSSYSDFFDLLPAVLQ
jgi:hypothetical protein